MVGQFPNRMLTETIDEVFTDMAIHKTSKIDWIGNVRMVREVGQKRKKGNLLSTPRRPTPPSLVRE